MADGIGSGVTSTLTAIENGASQIIAVGGEGTTNEVVNGIYKSNQSVKLGFIRSGTVNDYLHTINWPETLDDQISTIKQQEFHSTPLLEVSGQEESKIGLNVADIGVGAKIAYMASVDRKLTWIRGALRYQLLSLRALFGWKNIPATIVIDGEEYSDDLTLLTAGFSKYSGAYHLHPHAEPFGEKMAYTMAMNFSRWQMLTKMKMLERGDHTPDMDDIYMGHASRIEIRSEVPMLFEVDGEPFVERSKSVSITALPSALEVMKI